MSTTTANEHAELEGALSDLAAAAAALAAEPAPTRAERARQCLAAIEREAGEWSRRSALAKGLAPDGPWLGEEIVMGPMSAARHLRLTIDTLDAIARTGRPSLPTAPSRDEHGRLSVRVVPANGLSDTIAYKGFTADVRLREGVGPDEMFDLPEGTPTGVTLVLGAGNLTCIGLDDAAGQVLLHTRPTLLKVHPHFSELRSVFERVYAPLIEPGYLRILVGDASVGAAATGDARVSCVCLTGSVRTFERIVWGSDPVDAERRREQDAPLVDKTFIAELGNVTPWIVVPGRWSDKELRFQAENLAGSIVSNASYNCICPKVIVTSRGWAQRDEFLALVRQILASVPTRPAYYADSIPRYMELIGEPAGATPGSLPWTMLLDVHPDDRPELFEQENFMPVTAETALDSTDPADFLAEATTFVNSRLAGTLAASIVIHPSQRKDTRIAAALDKALDQLRYGTVAINHMAGIAFLMMSTPWGGHPSASRQDPESGLGFTNNTHMLRGVEKTIFDGLFRISPKPIWFPSNRNVAGITRALTQLYVRPSVLGVPKLLLAALRG